MRTNKCANRRDGVSKKVGLSGARPSFAREELPAVLAKAKKAVGRVETVRHLVFIKLADDTIQDLAFLTRSESKLTTPTRVSLSVAVASQLNTTGK